MKELQATIRKLPRLGDDLQPLQGGWLTSYKLSSFTGMS